MRQVLKFLKPYMKTANISQLLKVMESLADLYLPTLLASVVDKGVASGDLRVVLHYGLIMLVVAVGGAASAILCHYLASKVSLAFGTDVRAAVFEKIQGFSFADIDHFSIGSLIARTTNDVSQVQQLVLMFMRMMVRMPILFLGGLIMAFFIDARAALILLGSLPFLILAIYFVAKKGIPIFRQVQGRLDAFISVLREYLTGIRVIRAFSQTKREQKRFQKANDDLTGLTKRAGYLMAVMGPLVNILLNVTTACVLLYGGYRADQGTMTVGSIMALLNYITIILMALTMVTFIFVMLTRAFASAARITEVLEFDPSMVDGQMEREMTGKIEFDEVSFAYQGNVRETLKQISFCVEPGETLAVTGSTGCGKTTLAGLISRFYDATGGMVRIDGIDIRSYREECLRAQIGVALQAASLFEGTVEENVRFGRTGISDEEVRRALEVSQAAEFVDTLTDGVRSHIEARGANLSGGQKQRLALARALAGKPKILVLDDTTSALDFITESHLRSELGHYAAGCTKIMIAQRIPSLMHADKILVLENGEVAGMGSHEALLESCTVYREMFDVQMGGEAI